MNIQVIAEHSVDMDLLPERGNILDAGCRGFGFSNWFNLAGHRVFTVDADPYVQPNGGLNSQNHYNVAITNYTGNCYLVRSSDPQATKIEPMISEEFAIVRGSTPCYTLKELTRTLSVGYWDLIKLDIEGSEREVLMSMDKPYARQLSIEFHAHCAYDLETIDRLVAKLEGIGYIAIQHKIERRHGLGLNAWDSLFVLK